MSRWDIFRWRTLAGGPPCRQGRQRFSHRAFLSPRPKRVPPFGISDGGGTRLCAGHWLAAQPLGNHLLGAPPSGKGGAKPLFPYLLFGCRPFKVKVKAVRLRLTNRKLFEKSLSKNFSLAFRQFSCILEKKAKDVFSMALLQCNFFSQALMRTVPIQVVLPTDKTLGPGGPAAQGPFKTLYLLHGIFGNDTDWVCGTRVQSWAQDRNLAVVMPSGDNSFYVDNPKASAYYGRFIGQELVDFTRRSFPLSTRREDTFLGGLSMGGFGAIVNGLQHPQTFGAVAALSSALILDSMLEHTQYTDFLMTNKGYYESVFGELSQVRGGVNDYDALAEKVAKEPVRPKFYLACGTEDGLLGVNRQFRDHLLRLGYDVTYEEGPGVHDWYFWDEYILKALNWLPLADAQQGISSGNVGV